MHKTIKKASIAIASIILLLILYEDTALAFRISIAPATGNRLEVMVENNHQAAFFARSIYLEFDGQTYEQSFKRIIRPGEKAHTDFRIGPPSAPGSYPAIATIRFTNQLNVNTLSHAQLIHFGDPASLESNCIAPDAFLYEEGDIIVKSQNPALLRIILPEEVTLLSSSTFTDKKVFHVRTKFPESRKSYLYYAIGQYADNHRQYASMCKGHFSIGAATEILPPRGRVPSVVLLTATVVFLALLLLLPISGGSRRVDALLKFSSRMFFLSAYYLLIRNIAQLLSDKRFDLEIIDRMLKVLVYYFDVELEYFMFYFIDIYWIGCLLICLPYLYFLDNHRPAHEDKYVSFAVSVKMALRGKLCWNALSRLGALGILLKAVFIPFMVANFISKIFYQYTITNSFSFDFYTVFLFSITLLMLIDLFFFTTSYIFEFRFLKNQIISIEPTVLGWIACLLCYPPFNLLIPALINDTTVKPALKIAAWGIDAAYVSVLLSMALYLWATLSLGFKASNLTNRGIVTSGPYRFIRHPHYLSKIFTFLMAGIFLSEYTIGFLLLSVVIYPLRAWTEERHLMNDEGYREYMKMVKWRYIPGII